METRSLFKKRLEAAASLLTDDGSLNPRYPPLPELCPLQGWNPLADQRRRERLVEVGTK